MRGGESGASLPGDLDSFVRGQPANAANQRREVLSIDIFHSEKRNTFGIADIENAADVGMRNLACNAYFRMEPRQCASILRQAGRQKLNRYDLAQLKVFGTVHLAHASAAGQRNHAIAVSNNLPGRESSTANGIGAGKGSRQP